MITATLPSGPPGRSVSVTLPACDGREPGHPFGPESVPPATGSASVVYWVPGPLPGPTPLSNFLRHGAATAGRLTALAGWPGAGLASNIPSIDVMSTSPLPSWRHGSAVRRACSLLSGGDTIKPLPACE